MKRRHLFVPAAILAFSLDGCADTASGPIPAGADATISDTTVGTDASRDAVSVETIQPLHPSNIFERPLRLQGLPEAAMTSVATSTGRTVWLGSSQGLYRANSPDFEPGFVRGFEARDNREVSSVVERSGGQVVVLDSSFKVASSINGGLTWVEEPEVPRPDSFMRPHLVTNGQAVILVYGAGPLYLQTAPGEPWRALTTRHVDETDELHPLEVDAVAFGDDGKLYANSAGYFSQGVFQIDYEAATEPTARWNRVAGLDEAWGYTAFAFAGGEALTANASDFFLREGGAWRKVHSVQEDESAVEPPALALVAQVDALSPDEPATFVASGAIGLRRSVGGAVWEDLAGAPVLLEKLVAAGDRLFGASRGLVSSTDSGTSWTVHRGATATAHSVQVIDTQISAMFQGEWNSAAGFANSGQAVALAFDMPAGAEQLVTAHDALWTVTAAKELYTNLGLTGGADLVSADWGPNGNPDAYKHIFGNEIGLFAADRRGSGHAAPYCGLWRYNLDKGFWAEASFGLPGVGGCDAAVRAVTEAGGVLFAGTETGETYRSGDSGATWTRVREGVIKGAAECAGRIVALTEEGALWTSIDRGVTFVDDGQFILGSASSLVSVAGWCVVGLDSVAGGATLWASSPHGNAFEPLASYFIEPVVGLAASRDTLAVSTRSRGIFRVDIKQP